MRKQRKVRKAFPGKRGANRCTHAAKERKKQVAEPRLEKAALVKRNEQCCVVFLLGERKKIGLEQALQRSELGGREKEARRGKKNFPIQHWKWERSKLRSTRR